MGWSKYMFLIVVYGKMESLSFMGKAKQLTKLCVVCALTQCSGSCPRAEDLYPAAQCDGGAACHLHGGAARQGQDLHSNQAGPIPQLDRDQHQGKPTTKWLEIICCGYVFCVQFFIYLFLITMFKSVLWIRNDLFRIRIRIQLWIFRVPDPGKVSDPCGSGSNPCNLSIFEKL